MLPTAGGSRAPESRNGALWRARCPVAPAYARNAGAFRDRCPCWRARQCARPILRLLDHPLDIPDARSAACSVSPRRIGGCSCGRSCWRSPRRRFALAIPDLTGRAINQAIKPHEQLEPVDVGRADRRRGPGIGGALMVARRLIAGHLSLNVEYDLRQALYTHLQRLSFGFYDRHQTGQLLSRATSDVSAVRMFLGYGLVFITQYGASLIAASVLLVITSWQLALITFVLLPPIAIVATRYSRRSHPVLRDVQQRIADVTTQAEESIVGVRVVKAFAQEDTETDALRRAHRARLRARARLGAHPGALPPAARPPAAARLRGDRPRRRPARDRQAALARRVLRLQPLPRAC